ncbi:hypothetical protein PF010_g1848 [Phytophthora fragariae]|uniref:NYN domain-containing protein n=2 Tax=Phytophthora TaxID=4783 RepID=A0A6A3ME65_9STRA|nr:hypothetical protein PF011_g1590 [Phytophthora fragariae]KAE9048388.1 hypothetical protein PR002_g488 [Phytophthora rubi]KAE9136061.1 hypothetical protein PF010_g1848 [Phytophthora fragariae]KAE9254169.1 hypothetical protein PF004_g1177 [Phytophthora fragariae]
MSSTASTVSSISAMETAGSTRTALVIDGSYAMIGARDLGGKIDYIKLRAALEQQAMTQFGDCWFFDQNPSAQRLNATLTAEYHKLKFAPPDGPQFQVSLFPMKKYNCHCKRCGSHFTQNVQKGVDNGIATKILSLAYENICDRFILLAGDGDFYSSLSHVRNVLRKDIWVVGYRGSVSGDLQQLASRVLYVNDLWGQVKNMRQVRSHDQGRRNEGRRGEEGWFEDHVGEVVHPTNGSLSPLEDTEDVGSGRQVVIAPVEATASNRSNQPSRGKARGRNGRLNGRGKVKNGRGRSRSRSRDRPRGELPGSEKPCAPMAVAVPVVDAPSVSAPVAEKKKKSSNDGKRGAGGKNGKKRKRNENNERGRSKRGGRGDRQSDDVPVFTLSDISSDEETSKPFPLSLPVPLRSATATPVMTARERDAGLDEIDSRAQVIDLASDTESE